MQLLSRALILSIAGATLIVQVSAGTSKRFSGQEWTNHDEVQHLDDDYKRSEFKITRDMEVPALCWRPLWYDEESVQPYFRDRLIVDWSEKGDKSTVYHMAIWQVTGTALDEHVQDAVEFLNIEGNRAMIGINKYANDAVFVYYNEAIANGTNPGGDDPGKSKQDSIDYCRSQEYVGCHAFSLRTDETFHSLVFGLRIGGANIWPEHEGMGKNNGSGLYDRVLGKVQIKLHTNEVDGRAFFKCQGLPDGEAPPPPAR
ncbi:hypothetical protein P389DRAFT_88619 [Cystobasidium minutum MCA 4210]|uniref:uncharacterized protein n=1 Tax=Cystobasidium minutum MCA 4210 TaxID=1397322 RepID=UPI0034CFB571|eukprot:jgi/Rhomi1/88619/CE88618_66